VRVIVIPVSDCKRQMNPGLESANVLIAGSWLTKPAMTGSAGRRHCSKPQPPVSSLGTPSGPGCATRRMMIRFASAIFRPVRRVRRAPVRAVRRAWRAILRPVRRVRRATRRATRLVLRADLLACRFALAIRFLLELTAFTHDSIPSLPVAGESCSQPLLFAAIQSALVERNRPLGNSLVVQTRNQT
jgi:hypothetical protein